MIHTCKINIYESNDIIFFLNYFDFIILIRI